MPKCVIHMSNIFIISICALGSMYCMNAEKELMRIENASVKV